MSSAGGPNVDARQANSGDLAVLLLSEIRDLLRAQDFRLARLENIQSSVQEAPDRPLEGVNTRAGRTQENSDAAIGSQDLPLNVSAGLELHKLTETVLLEKQESDPAEDSLSVYNNKYLIGR